MTKAMKELCIVMLGGAGVLALLWGLLNQINLAYAGRPPEYVSDIAWDVVWVGVGLIAASVALAIFVKPTR
ncbi:MAG: hypothetical protein FWE97_02205 [Dehalococcoidia bacterium]|nr:hypothetical protein [Dehalococcoidia bacterium]